MRANPAFDAATAITELGVGEALISFLDEKGRPSVVERVSVIAPCSRLGPMSDDERGRAIKDSLLFGHYEKVLDRESAYELLRANAEAAQDAVDAPPAKSPAGAGGGSIGGALGEVLFGSTGPRGGRRDGVVQAAAKSAARSIASSLGRQIVRGLLGSLLGGSRRR